MPDHDPIPHYDGWRHVPRDTLRSATEWRHDGRRLREGARPAAVVWSRACWSTRRRQRPVDLYDVADTEPRPLRRARRVAAVGAAEADPAAAGVPDLSAAVLALPPPRAR